MHKGFNVLEAFPHLLPEDPSFRSFSGYITIHGHEFKVAITIPENGRLADAQLMLSPDLLKILGDARSLIETRLSLCSDVNEFLLELKRVLESRLQSNPIPKLPPAAYFTRLMQEVGSIGWHRLTFLSDDMLTMGITLRDTSGREHNLQIQLASDYPASAPQCSISLPQPLTIEWIPHQSNLTTLIAQYEKALDQYQRLWDVLDDFDNNTIVIEPMHPLRSDISRRIFIAKFVSVQVKISWQTPYSVPELSFFGADSAIQPLKEKLHNRDTRWDEKKMPRENLENVLEIKFPKPGTVQKSDIRQECSICYSYKLGDAIPDQVCGNPSCAKPYHAYCLYETLKNTSGVEHMRVIKGNCPYCQHQIMLRW